MNTKIFSVAQIKTVRENCTKNIEKHMEFINLAVKHSSKLILFPELSLTGYERELAREQFFVEDDERLECFRKASVEHDIIIIAGAPLLLEDHLYIASWIFNPDGTQEIYTKKYLHPGEELYFHSSTQYDPLITLSEEQLSLAICYDIEVEEHIIQVKERKSDYYAASIFYSQKGIQSGLTRLQYIAKEYSIAVLMSNYVGTCWDTLSGGFSSIWSKNGDLVIAADADTECLLVAENRNEEWNGKMISI
jgi:predicted amidohydrolase